MTSSSSTPNQARVCQITAALGEALTREASKEGVSDADALAAAVMFLGGIVE